MSLRVMLSKVPGGKCHLEGGHRDHLDGNATLRLHSVPPTPVPMASPISPKVPPIIAPSPKVPVIPSSTLHSSKIVGPSTHPGTSKIASTASLGSSKVASSTLEATRRRPLSLLLLLSSSLLPSSYAKVSCQHISHRIFTSLRHRGVFQSMNKHLIEKCVSMRHKPGLRGRARCQEVLG